MNDEDVENEYLTKIVKKLVNFEDENFLYHDEIFFHYQTENFYCIILKKFQLVFFIKKKSLRKFI